MSSIVGFTIHRNLATEQAAQAKTAEERALARFTHLQNTSLTLGATTLRAWGHREIQDCIHSMPDGSTLALIGSPHSKVDWQNAQEALLKTERPEQFVLPWEGRIILLQVSADGNRWRIWNDWLGSIPAFLSQPQNGRILSTLEPVTTAAAGCTRADFFLPGLASHLINGYGLWDWTIFKNVKTLLPDRLTEWDDQGISDMALWTVQPTQDRWERNWDDLVDEMYALSRNAILNTLKTSPAWTLPLSSGFDSRLIAGVTADAGMTARTYAWGSADNTDVHYSSKIARALGFPWKHVSHPDDFLLKYTPQWHDWFGTSIHFQGMYLMYFLDALQAEPPAPVITGFMGDVLAGDGVVDAVRLSPGKRYQVDSEWYSDWQPDELRAVAKFPIEEALEANAAKIKDQIDSFPGAHFQKMQLLQFWNRQRLITSYLSILMHYWRGVVTPFMDRNYVRFCLSLPRAALDRRRLMADVFRRHYGRLAVIPGTYGQEPLIPTGSYLLKKRIAQRLPMPLRRLMKGSVNVARNIDSSSIRVHGKKTYWPLFEAWDELGEWFDLGQLAKDYEDTLTPNMDARPLRRLQAIQSIAPRFLKP